TKCMIIM
nr:Chain P, MET-ILE-ILE-MET [synthetic construct]